MQFTVDNAPNNSRDIAWPSRRTGDALPVLLTVDEAAALLRTTRRAIYAMVERRQLPGIIRIGRRVLLRADDLLDWLDQKRAPSLRSNSDERNSPTVRERRLGGGHPGPASGRQRDSRAEEGGCVEQAGGAEVGRGSRASAARPWQAEAERKRRFRRHQR